MKTSPIQLLRLDFRTVNVGINPGFDEEKVEGDLFSFDGVVLDTSVGAQRLEGHHEKGSLWSVFLGVRVTNEPDPKRTHQRFCPYNILVELHGLVMALNGAEKIKAVENLVKVNGAAVLWGAAREQVSGITARMPRGTIVLPTVNFHDLIDTELDKLVGESEPESATIPEPFSGAIRVDRDK